MSKSYKVAILTQPLKNNFGGNLQAFALQKVIYGFNIDVETINYTVKNKSIYHELKNNFKKFLGLKYKKSLNTRKNVEKREKNHIRFLGEKLNLSHPIYTRTYALTDSKKY